MNHTPGPWKVVEMKLNNQTRAVYVETEGAFICDMQYQEACSEEEKRQILKDAAYIVHCVNTHDALVEALQQMLKSFEYWQENNKLKPLLHACDQAEKALAMAEKGS